MTTKCNDIIPSSGSDTLPGSVSLSDATFIFRTGFRLLPPVFVRLGLAAHYKTVKKQTCGKHHNNVSFSDSYGIRSRKQILFWNKRRTTVSENGH